MAAERDEPRRRWWWGAGIGAVLVLLAAVVTVVVVVRSDGPGAAKGPDRPEDPHEVVIVGDSVTYLSSPSIYRRFDGRAPLQVKSIPFYRTIDLVTPFQTVIDGRRAAGRPLDRLLVLAGYNDVARRSPSFAGLRQMMDQADEFECAVWLTLPEDPEGRRPEDPDLTTARVRAWNREVREVARAHPHVHVSTAWADVVDSADPHSLLKADALHPRFAGQERLAEVMEDALQDTCG